MRMYKHASHPHLNPLTHDPDDIWLNIEHGLRTKTTYNSTLHGIVNTIIDDIMFSIIRSYSNPTLSLRTIRIGIYEVEFVDVIQL